MSSACPALPATPSGFSNLLGDGLARSSRSRKVPAGSADKSRDCRRPAATAFAAAPRAVSTLPASFAIQPSFFAAVLYTRHTRRQTSFWRLPIRAPMPGSPKQSAPRIGLVSLGCPKALVDSERIITRLRAEGYELSASYEGADAVVVNTCGFLAGVMREAERLVEAGV